MRIAALKLKIKQIQDYLGPRLGYSSNYWPHDPIDKALLKELIKLKQSYYRRLRWRRRFRMLIKFITIVILE